MRTGPVVVDIEGLELQRHEVERLRNPLVGGLILFARNFASRKQLTELTAAIHAVRAEPLLIAVDQEGGRVQRFRSDGFTALPAMRKLGALWDENPMAAVRAAGATGFILGSELRACGVDLSFTPVLDLEHGTSSVIGDRAFHGDARVVALLAGSLVHGMALAGMGSCGKHFPGHGYVAADSHHEIPVDGRDLETILAADAAPYGWIGSPALAAVMPAHVIYPKVDPLPAGYSRKWLQSILRRRLRFDGVVFSDDLSMEGAAAAGGITERARAALSAGCDMVLVCNAPQSADRLLAELKVAQKGDSAGRILRLFHGAAPDWGALQASADYGTARNLVRKIS